MPPVYKLRIEGCKPETLPMARLAEYMADFAALLGEPEHVHFADLAKGSAVLAAKVEPEAAAKVDSRLAAVAGRKATGDLHRAARALNNRLAADNATGSLTGAARSNAKAALLVKFPGRERERLLAPAAPPPIPAQAGIQLPLTALPRPRLRAKWDKEG